MVALGHIHFFLWTQPWWGASGCSAPCCTWRSLCPVGSAVWQPHLLLLKALRGVLHVYQVPAAARNCTDTCEDSPWPLCLVSYPPHHQTLPLLILLNWEDQARLPLPQSKSHLFCILQSTQRVLGIYLAPFPDFWAEIDSPIFKQFLLLLSVVVWGGEGRVTCSHSGLWSCMLIKSKDSGAGLPGFRSGLCYLTSCVSLDKLLNFSGPLFLHFHDEGIIYLTL